MEAVLNAVGHSVALVIEAIAIVVIVTGTVEAVGNIVRILRAPHVRGVSRRAVWLDFAGWLVAALTFQLAADIVSTSFSPNWDQVGRLGAIAAIRTFLSYFLDREVEGTQKLQYPAAIVSGARPMLRDARPQQGVKPWRRHPIEE